MNHEIKKCAFCEDNDYSDTYIEVRDILRDIPVKFSDYPQSGSGETK